MARPLSSKVMRETADLIDKDIAKRGYSRAVLRAENTDGCNDDEIKETSRQITVLKNEADDLRDKADKQDISNAGP